jgi:hypothetical protein
LVSDYEEPRFHTAASHETAKTGSAQRIVGPRLSV